MNPQNDKLVFLGNPLMSFSFREFLNGNAEVLGEGSIGTSYKVVLKEGTTVVVKKLRDLASSTEQFKEQMEMLGAMDHENIIPLRGYQGKSLLYDYLPMGSLSALLHGFRKTGMSPLSWEIRRAIALGAARGIEYLHSQGPNVYHGSIKSSNVLLTATYDAQVSDYGLNQLKTPSNHPASEVADCQKADVYSFGVLLLELLLGKAPTNSFNLPSWVHSAIQEELDGTIDVFDPELLSYQHVEELTGLLHVAMVCVAQCPGMLPSMSEVRRMIEELFIPSVLSDWDLQLDQINELNHDTSTWKLPDEALSVSENAYVSDKAFMWANILMLDFETELFGICKEFGAEITSLQMDAATSAAPVDFPNDEEEKKNQIAERTKKIELQEPQDGDQEAYSIIPSRDANMSIKENEAQELPVWSNTGSTSILPLMPPPKLEAAVHSAEDGSWASAGTPSESACPSLNQNFDSQCGITLDRNGQSSILSNLTCSLLSSSGQFQSSLITLPPPPPQSSGASSSNAISSDPPASAPSPTPLVSTLLNEEEVLDLPNDYGAQMEQLVPSFQQYQYASFARMIIKPPKLQAVKQQLSTSLAMSQDITSGVKTEFPNGEEGIAPVSEKEFEVNSIGGCASLLPRNGSNVKATAATHNPAQLPETMLLHLEEPLQMEDSPSSTSMSSGYDYDVFLSFRGPDTRSGIVDFLYTSLLAAGIHTYRDNEELRVGDEIGPGLQKAICHSQISIPIFSKGYASSKWCLNELVQMVECRKKRRQKIMPIFYNVAPSEVRHQTGFYGEAFASHEKRFDNKVISKWKAALKEAGELKGWDSDWATNRREGELVKLIVHKVVDELKKAYLLVTDCLVGVENHVKEINRMMCGDSEDTRILGIYGLGGVGKTTLAKIIYNQLSHGFEDCCFLSAIKETSELKGIECLQNQLISDILKRNWTTISNVDEGMKTIKERLSGKKVLVLLDDVDKRTHLNSLMGKPAWFGLGSRIIITSRNKDIVDVPEVACTYELVSMDFNQSLQLFCNHAFRSDYPPDEYDAFSTEVVKTTGGLPLALDVIGSQLSGKSKDVWDVTLKKLRKVPHEEVKRKLKISYDALDDSQKHIFLDIACLFVGFDIRIVIHMWNETNIFPGEGLRVLQQLSLIKLKENKLWMHNQLRDLGRDIVRRECNMELEKQTRLWDHEEALDILMKKKGSKKIEALSLKFDNQLQCYYANQEFERLSNLKYLEMRVVPENWPSNDFAANIQKHPPMLSKLRWLSWHQFPLDIKLINLSMMNIVILDLSWSKFSESWVGWTHIKMAGNLKVLNLTGCAHLHRTPDFSANVNLEHLILENCARLVQIDISIGHLTQLVFLNLRFCIKLRKLPEEICNLESLKELLIDGTSIREIPEWRGMKTLETLSACECLSLNNCRSIGNLMSILRLSLENVEITQLPPEIGELVKLEYLSLSKCKLLRRLPDSIGNLESLILLNLSYTHVEELPDSLGKLKNLKVLRMYGSSIRIIPSSVGMLEKLEEIDAEFCWRLKGAIPDGIGRLLSLRVLKLSNTRIYQVPRLPESLISVQISTQSMTTLPDLSNLINLIDLDLDIREVPLAKEDSIFVESSQLVQYPSPWWIGHLCNLESLKLSCDTIVALHKDIVLLSQLKKLELLCSNLQFLPSLPSNLRCLLVKSSQSMETSIDLSELKELSELRIDSSAVTGIQGLYDLENLKILDFRALNSLERLPDISNLKKLSELHLEYCHNLIDVQSISGLGNLRILKLIAIPLLERLPDLSNLKKLTELHLWDCHGVTEIPSFEDLENLIMLKLGELPLLERLPDLSNLKKLTKLHLGQCQNLVEVQGILDSLEDLCIEGCKSLVEVPDPSSFKKLKSLHICDCEKLHVDKIRFSDLEIPDRAHENSTCLILSKIGFCVCQLGKEFFLPSFSS
ncbi:disease resistance protein L6-like isoform X1 [Syzygium oleosum]|uniref:disease resistance protein L6-like isoform X1 n=1 Tax=Syzygium oleosum TaxID=219896 RepID=UPI0024BA0FBB|nr:disease resistance protein L6-like isoform X1 [Syzygium oleosum]